MANNQIEFWDYLQERDPYPCLNILESAITCKDRFGGKRNIPTALLEDMAYIFGRETVEKEIKNLEDMLILKSSDDGFSINDEMFVPLYDLIKQLKRDLMINLDDKEEKAGSFLKNLVFYLEQQVSNIIIDEIIDETDYILRWDGKRYRLKLAFSPAWLPLFAEVAEQENSYIAIFGPFAAQKWEIMLKYYRYPEFRNYTAYYDPWYHQKINISKGGLFSYFDWFFRDYYGNKFSIPDEFTKELQNLGLIRYNDEK